MTVGAITGTKTDPQWRSHPSKPITLAKRFRCQNTFKYLYIMPHIPILKPEDAPPDVKTVYQEFIRKMSFPQPPNFIMTQGHSPSVARGTWELVRNVLVGGEIPRWAKEMVFVAISLDRQCRYCSAAHLACCRMLGVTPGTLEYLVHDVNTLTNPQAKQMILFALKCSRNPQSLVASDFALLSKQGLSQSQIVELISMSALAVYANIIADATAMDPDPMFEQIQSAPPLASPN
jgi:uncharacterized peroxidase-related enzyme